MRAQLIEQANQRGPLDPDLLGQLMLAQTTTAARDVQNGHGLGIREAVGRQAAIDLLAIDASEHDQAGGQSQRILLAVVAHGVSAFSRSQKNG
jgi:nitroreductase